MLHCYTAFRYSRHPFLSDGDGGCSPAWVWADPAPGLTKLLILEPRSSRPAPHWVPCSDYTTSLVLQMSKVTGWDYLVSAGRNIVCQDLCTGFWKSLPTSLSQSYFKWLSPTDSTAISVGKKNRVGAPTKQPTMLGQAGGHLWALSSQWRNYRLMEDLSAWCYTGGGGCSQHVVTPFTFLIQSVLASVMQRLGSPSLLCSRILSVVSSP